MVANKLAGKYDEWYSQECAHWENAPGKNVLLAALRDTCGSLGSAAILDIGCGTGSLLQRVLAECSAEPRVFGIDFSLKGVSIGKRRHPNLNLLCGDATVLPFGDESFDAILCYGSWEHFRFPQKAIADACRLLKRDGWVFAMMPTLGVYRTDRDDEGWYEDLPVAGSDFCQLQWNLKRQTWVDMFLKVGITLLSDTEATNWGAKRPGVFYVGRN